MRASRRFLALILGVAVLGTLLGGARPARAAVILANTFGEPGDTFDQGNQSQQIFPNIWPVFGSGVLGFYENQAAPFTASATANLSEVRVATSAIPLGPVTFDVIVAADNGGVPGTPIVTIPNVSPPGSAFGHIKDLFPAAHPLLQQGTPYWLILEPSDPTGFAAVGWNYSLPQVNTGHMFAQGTPGGSWSDEGTPLAAFEVLGGTAAATVPEPSSLALLGLGAAVLAGWRRRQRRQGVGSPR
jgi:PEP-CTERM motif